MVVIEVGIDTWHFIFFFQAEDGIRDLVRSRGLGDVYKRQVQCLRIYRIYRSKCGAKWYRCYRMGVAGARAADAAGGEE